VVYDKQKTALMDDPSDLINTRLRADFCYFVHFYALNSGGISQEYDFIQHIFVSV
jgi:hypothetical protein